MLDLKEEARFVELKDKCRELKVPAPPEIMIGLQVHEGGVLTFDDVQRGHSWNRNFYNIACNYLVGVGVTSGSYGAGYISIKQTNGGVLAIYTSALIDYGTVGTTKGLIVGSNDAAFSIENYALASQIGTGSGSGQLAYQAESASSAYAAGTTTWTLTRSRIFNNNSGSSITVKESGLCGYNINGYYSLWERSVLSPTVAVPNGAQLTVTYAISMDFSAID
jgi:hypothetical protein